MKTKLICVLMGVLLTLGTLQVRAGLDAYAKLEARVAWLEGYVHALNEYMAGAQQ